MLPAAPCTRDKRQSIVVLINTQMGQENAVFIHKRVVLFYKEYGDCVLCRKMGTLANGHS